jgi:hypothetical protein
MENYFTKLNTINVNDKVEKKNNLSYLTWSWAWGELLKIYPNATYKIKKFGENQLPYVYDENTGYMVFTELTIEDITHEMWLPVMDGANKAMKNHPYTYKVLKYENKQKVWNATTKSYETIDKTVDQADMFDINKTIMRCLVKNIAMFGLGLYIYAGEDLPEVKDDEYTPIIKEEVNYKQAVKDKVEELGLDFKQYCIDNKLSAKTTQEEAKALLDELNATS